jgi:hypothetical protein
MKATLLTLVVIATAAFSVPALADPVVEVHRDNHYRYDRDYQDRDYQDRDYQDRDYHEYSRDRDWEYHHRHHHHHRPAVSIELGR